MVERKLDGSYLLTLYREWIKSIRKKNEFLKNMSKNYIKIKMKIIQFFQDRVLAKKRPLRDAARPKKQVFEKHTQRLYKNEKEIYSFFQIRVLAKKEAPAGSRWPKKKFLKNTRKGYMKKGSAKRMKKKRSLKVTLVHDGHGGMADGCTIGNCYTPRAWRLPRAKKKWQGRTRHGKNRRK